MPEKKLNGQSNGHNGNGQTMENTNSELDLEIQKLIIQVKESRKSCKNTAQLLQELNGIFRE